MINPGLGRVAAQPPLWVIEYNFSNVYLLLLLVKKFSVLQSISIWTWFKLQVNNASLNEEPLKSKL